MLPFNRYSPPLATHRSTSFLHWWRQCWKTSFVRAFRSFADFHFTSSIDTNRVPFKADLIFGNKKKSQGAKSGEYDACSSTGVPPAAKWCFTDSALWAGALSWCKIHNLNFPQIGPKLSNNECGLHFDLLESIQSSGCRCKKKEKKRLTWP